MPHLGRRSALSCACLTMACLTVVLARPTSAQSATGIIEGLALDMSGGALPGVAITLLHPATGVERKLVTDPSGFFRAPLLPVGGYVLTAALEGFAPWQRTDLQLTVGQTLSVRIRLAVAGLAEAIVVSPDTAVLEPTRGQVGSTIDEAAVRNLPVNGRNFLDFVLLTPGVARDVRAGDLSFAGQRGTLNSLVVDGADDNNTFFGQTLGRTGSGRAPYQFSLDAVQEFHVNANSYSAEYGRAGGAVINVVTRSGTNDWSASTFEFYRDEALNAKDAIDVLYGRPKGPYHFNQFGGTVGGPIRRNRDFVFGTYDGQRNTQPNTVILNLPPSTPSDPATIAAIEELTPRAGSWERRLDQDVILVRTDHQVSTAHRLTFRYNHQDFTGTGYEQGGPEQSLEHTGDSLVGTRTLNATWAGAFAPCLFNELRLQYARDDEPGTANSDDPEAVVRQSGTTVLFIGRNNFSPRGNTIDRAQVADTLTSSLGSHTLKAGVDVQVDRIHNYFPGFFGGSYTFQSLASFSGGRPTGPGESYQQSFAGAGTTGPRTRPDARDTSVFVQDEWRPGSDVTVNLGLRYDVMRTAAPPVRNPDPQLAAAGIDTSRLATDTNNWGPRAGIAWNPNNRVVVRGGGGLFYGRTPAIALTTIHANNGVNVVSLTFTGAAVPTYPERFDEIPAGNPTRPNIFYVDDQFANARVLQSNAGVEWMLARHTSLAATYVFVDGTELTRSVDRNLGSLGSRTFTIAGSGERVSYPFFASNRPFTNFQRVIALEASAESRYHGLALEVTRRFVDDLEFRVGYTVGRVGDTVPDATAVAPGNAGDDAKYASHPTDFEVDRAPGNNDRRHRLVGSGVYATTRLADRVDGVARVLATGWWVSAIFTAESGRPYSARVGGVDLNGDGNNFNDLAPGTRRNSFRLPAIATLDVRLARDVPLGRQVRTQLIWEAFNLFNRANINAVLPAYYVANVAALTLTPNPLFGQPISSAGARIMQLGIRVTF